MTLEVLSEWHWWQCAARVEVAEVLTLLALPAVATALMHIFVMCFTTGMSHLTLFVLDIAGKTL